ncbi:MAG: hypothetical protein IJU39_04975 [Clostridia bacterium]|nr:hypothetical protein [Clostridia bacterium]
MKQWKKMLCVMLTFVMIFTTVSIGVSAGADLGSPGYTDSHGTKSLNAKQRATLLLNMVDEALAKADIKIDYSLAGVASINLDFRSIDLAIYTLNKFVNGDTYEAACKVADLGDLESINDAYLGKCYRNQGDDLAMIVNLVAIAFTNLPLIYNYMKGTISLGILDSFVDKSKIVIDIGAKVKDALYHNLVSNFVDECPPGTSADWIIQHAIDTYLLGGDGPDGLAVEGYLPSMAGKTSFSNYTLYQWIENAANAAMTDYIMPIINTDVKKYIKELAGYTDVNDDGTGGDDSEVDDFIKTHINFDYNFTGYTWGNTSEGIFGQINDFIDYVLSVVWTGDDFWVGGDNSHIISNLRSFALNIYETFAEQLIPDTTEIKPISEIEAMDAEELVVYVGQAFVEKYIDYIVIDHQCTTLEELGCYIGMHFAAEVIPNQNYMNKIAHGQATISKELLIQIFTDIGVYYLQAYTPITGLRQGVSLENNMMAIIRWANQVDNSDGRYPGGNFGGIFQKCDTSGTNPWTILDNTIFTMIPLSLLNGVSGSYDLVMNHIVNAALDLRIDTILSMFYKNSSSPMNQNALRAVCTIVNNVLNVVINASPIDSDAMASIDHLLYKDYLANIAGRIVIGVASMGGDLFKSALQFITPFIGLEDDIPWLKVVVPASFQNKTIEELDNYVIQCFNTLGIPDDVYDEDPANWNSMVDFEGYTYLRFYSAYSEAKTFIRRYYTEIAKYDLLVEAGYGDYVTDPRLTEKYGQSAINAAFYNLQETFGRLQQRGANTSQLDYIIQLVTDQGYKAANYPARVWAAYQKALKHAKAVTNIAIYENEEDEEDPINKQSMVNYARRELIHAWKTLENPTADYTVLDELIRQAKAIDTSLYTEDSVAILNYVIAEAEEFEQTIRLQSDQNEVDNMARRLYTAIQLLVPLKVDSDIVGVAEGVIVDAENNYISGLAEYLTADDIKDYLGTSNGGEIVVTPSGEGGEIGTGSKIDLYINGELDKSFDVVIFGDLTGDGAIDESDFVIIDLYNAWVLDDDGFEGSAYYFAGDVTGDDCIDESDIAIVDLVNAWVGEIDQTDPYNFVFY